MGRVVSGWRARIYMKLQKKKAKIEKLRHRPTHIDISLILAPGAPVRLPRKAKNHH